MKNDSPRAKKAQVVHAYQRVSVVENLIRLYEVQGRVAVIEILADLRHYCDHREYDFAELDREAHGRYVSELRGGDHD